MARRPKPKSFGADRPVPTPARAPRQQVIPDAVANRMVRRIAIATGTPTVLGMGVFVASYLLVSRGVLDIPPGLTLVGSGAFFLLGLLGLSYGVLSASWEDAPGSLLGFEQIGVNIGRVRASVRAMRQGASGTGSGSGTPQG
ncbi:MULTISPECIES: PAM68 family protein [unclassified Synechococcus]|uniref:PAM68 family protein n=1 Tax=unclassified Synechococcus TaxID=2626047 RepID=UPI000B99A6D0|nr:MULTISPECIES: PAM68 family protein [unclassified Synechococcus]MBD2717479.1 PAM68 family protein [Synechococcus sp. FACHB-909]